MLFGLSEPTRLRLLWNFFIAFGIAERAVHSTINKFSKDGLRAKGDIHQLVRDLIRQQSRAAGEAEQVKLVRKFVGGRGRRLFGEDVHGRTYLPFVRFEAEETTFLFLKIWVHRAVEMDATALFGKWSARSYPDWEMSERRLANVLQMYADGGVYMMRAFGRWERLGSSFLSHTCPAEARGHEVSHEGAHDLACRDTDDQTDVSFRPTQQESHMCTSSEGGRAVHEEGGYHLHKNDYSY